MLSYENILAKEDFRMNKKETNNYKYVRFWKSKIDENLSPFESLFIENCLTKFPVENTANEDNSSLINKLVKLQNEIKNDDNCMKSYYGCSMCRICGINNGNSEYIFNNFVWPEGYIHYIRDHNIEIDDEFKEFLNKIE